MKTRVFEVDIDERRADLTSFMRSHLAAHQTDGHFEWMYRSNPLGNARVWMATVAEGDDVIGVAAAFPRRMHVRGEEVTCWNLGDFAVAPEHRSLGPAVQLQRACLKEVMEGGVPFAYDHPSCNMTAIYRWMKVPITGTVVRYVMPLRVDEKVKEVLGDRLVSSAVSSVGNVLLGSRRRGLVGDARYPVERFEERFDDRVTELDRRVSTDHPVVGARTSDYLNWRYLDNPNHRYEILVAEDDGRWIGYVVFRNDGKMAFISDLYGEKRVGLVESLVAAVVSGVGDGAVQTLSVPVLESSPLIPALTGMGFQPRDTASFVVSVRPESTLDGTVNELTNWFLTDGDRDV